MAPMPPLLQNPVQHLLALAAGAGTRALVVGLVGVPGAGKSTLAARWVHEVNAMAGAGTALALGMDGFHLTRAQLAQMPDPATALARRGAPWTFDAQALAQRLRAVREATAPVPWPGFDHGVGDPVQGAISIPPSTRLLIVEGLYLLHQGDGWALGGLLDECAYLDVPLPVAMQRLSARHQAAWGFTPAQAQARIAANDGLNAVLVAQSRERADWLVTEPAL
jgi:pantothenate kinase